MFPGEASDSQVFFLNMEKKIHFSLFRFDSINQGTIEDEAEEKLSLSNNYYRITSETRINQKAKTIVKQEETTMTFNEKLMERVNELILSPVVEYSEYAIKP